MNVKKELNQEIMINEVVPSDPMQDFYGHSDADYLKTTIPLLQGAGAEITSIQDILQMGIYITNAVKIPKKELALFPNVKVIMLMGNVAKKMFNRISKKETKKNAVPSIASYHKIVHINFLRSIMLTSLK